MATGRSHSKDSIRMPYVILPDWREMYRVLSPPEKLDAQIAFEGSDFSADLRTAYDEAAFCVILLSPKKTSSLRRF